MRIPVMVVKTPGAVPSTRNIKKKKKKDNIIKDSQF